LPVHGRPSQLSSSATADSRVTGSCAGSTTKTENKTPISYQLNWRVTRSNILT